MTEMSEHTLQTSDGHKFIAECVASDVTQSAGGIIILHEIFGLTDYIKEVCDYWSSRGFNVVAPSLFDRQSQGIIVDYSDPARGKSIANDTSFDEIAADIEASKSYLLQKNRRIGIIGFCWGGGIAYRAACKIAVDAVACVYGTRLTDYAVQSPKCPTQFHFGEHDAHTPKDVREKMKVAAPDARQFIYDAGHGFDRQSRSDTDRMVRTQMRDNIYAFLKTELAV